MRLPHASCNGKRITHKMVILLALLVVLFFFGIGFAEHLLWIAAFIFLAVWLVGFAMGRGRNGRHHFFHW